MKVDIDKIINILEPVIVDEGFELVDAEFKQEQAGWVLRLYIDKDGGVTIDDCAVLSREIGNLLDVEDALPLAYNLEVSSPGLNRPLRKKEHFQKVIGGEIKVRTKLPVEGSRNFRAKLVDVGASWIKIENEVKTVRIEIENIEKANLIYHF